tara:strand:+ start:61 stop:837 length:777 start_codon:yes stop_codon:yes gene_type:complete
MGILNITPDSFYDGNKTNSLNFTKNRYNLIEKAHIIDIGAESSRPGSEPVSSKDEIERLKILSDFNLENKFLSIDSYKHDVIKYCLNSHFNMINDISGGGDNFENINLAKEYDVPICIMHMLGNPKIMQKNPKYDSLIDNLIDFFSIRIEYCEKIGFDLDKLIIDPGIGFGKTVDDNFKIISNIYKLKKLGCKILIGLSRKSFLEIHNDQPSERLGQSITMQCISVLNGANIIRTHDVLETIKSIEILKKYGITRIYK